MKPRSPKRKKIKRTMTKKKKKMMIRAKMRTRKKSDA